MNHQAKLVEGLAQWRKGLSCLYVLKDNSGVQYVGMTGQHPYKRRKGHSRSGRCEAFYDWWWAAERVMQIVCISDNRRYIQEMELAYTLRLKDNGCDLFNGRSFLEDSPHLRTGPTTRIT